MIDERFCSNETMLDGFSDHNSYFTMKCYLPDLVLASDLRVDEQADHKSKCRIWGVAWTMDGSSQKHRSAKFF
jgi:hypothetical protein